MSPSARGARKFEPEKFGGPEKNAYLCRPLRMSALPARQTIIEQYVLKRLITMKKDIHPSNYREVVFKDMSNDEIFITRSTVASRETIEVDGKTYPLVKLEITSASHPFFTGKQKLVDTAGRVDKFMSRYGNRNKK